MTSLTMAYSHSPSIQQHGSLAFEIGTNSLRNSTLLKVALQRATPTIATAYLNLLMN